LPLWGIGQVFTSVKVYTCVLYLGQSE